MELFYIPSNGCNLYHGYYAVAEKPEEALVVFKWCWKKIAHDVDKERNLTLNDLVVVEKEITLPNRSQKAERILNTYVGLVDIKIIDYFDKPVFFGWDEKVGPYETHEILLSPEAWRVYSYDYDGRASHIWFQADDIESGVKVRVDLGTYRVVWMYTYETDTIYNEVYKDNEDEAIEFALSIVRDAKILRKKYREIYG